MCALTEIDRTLLCFSLAVLVFPSYGISDGPQQQNVTTIHTTLGEDVFMSCTAPSDPLIYVWQKNDVNVEADQAYVENRIYVLKGKGMLLLNTEERDGGLFICTFFDRTLHVQKYRLEVVVPTEETGDSGDAFQCGYPRQRSRIVGGRQVNDPGAYPWMALLWHKREQRPFCAGTLLSRRFVVTAATCFMQSGYHPNEVEVRLGEYNISSTESYEVTMQIAAIIPHSNYDSSTYDADILLIRLQQPVVYSDYIIPICLPSELLDEHLLQPGKRGYITGWGKTDPSANHAGYQTVLRQARLTVTNHETCGEQHSHIVTNNMFCAIGGSRRNGVRDACSGDNGGPFMIKDEQRYHLVGIVSWGIGCANINFPGVYTRVGRFRRWILENTNSDIDTCREEDLHQYQLRIQSLEEQVINLQGYLQSLQNNGEVTTTFDNTRELRTDQAPA